MPFIFAQLMPSPFKLHQSMRNMVSLALIFVITAALASVYGQSNDVTTGTQDYFTISQHELLHEIEMTDFRIEAFDERFAARLKVIHYQQEQLLTEINRVNQTLMPLQALSLVRKHCIQKYNKQLWTYDNAKKSLDICYDVAATGGRSLTEDSRMYASNARLYTINVFPTEVASCDSDYSQNQTALENCYIANVESGKATVHDFLNKAEEPLQKNAFEADTLSRTAVQCSFQVENDVLKTIAISTQDIDVCEADVKRQSTAAVAQSTINKSSSIQNVLFGKLN